MNTNTSGKLNKLMKDIEKLEKQDWYIILNIISRFDNYKPPLITETKKGTYINLSVLNDSSIKNIEYFLKIKKENDKINKLKEKNKI